MPSNESRKPNRKRTLRQKLALAGVVLLAAMYLCALVSAFFKSDAAQALFRASIACTILVPIFLYAFLLAAKAVRPSKSPVVDSVVFDVGKTLVDFPWEEYIQKLPLSGSFREIIFKDERFREIWDEMDRGSYSYDHGRALMHEAFPQYSEDVDVFLDNIDKCMELFPYTMHLVSELKRRGYKVYVLSNWSEYFYDVASADGRLGFEVYTDGAFWSYAHHLLKPDPAFFKKLIDTYQIDPARSVFIDDVQKNIDAASDLGFLTIRFADYPALVEQLKTLGVRV